MTGALARSNDASIAWLRFAASPAGYAAPERLAAAFDDAITPEACRRLLALPRLEARLSELLCARNGLSAGLAPEVVSDSDRSVLLLTPALLHGLVRRAGAIYLSGALSQIVLANDVRALDKALGPGVFARAMARRDLGDPANAPTPSAVSELVEQIDRAGWSCLLAWAAQLPTEIGARLRLQMPGQVLPLDAITPDLGRSIIEAAHRAEAA
ncbi:hypothetical protein WBO78_26980 [Bosea sp. CCNWLW174]|uniref:hypothetical protein n=1 Tax=unclassified Bosea (in: a-proteobacteria) TaxID=2653178 RepID=UPI0030151837